VLKFFAGLDLLPPGVVPIQEWHPDSDPAAVRSAMRGGAAIKP
jgi:hypothetical protein